MVSVAQKSESILGKRGYNGSSSQPAVGRALIWCPNCQVIEKAMLDPTGDIPPEPSRAKSLRRGILLFVLE